MAASAASRELLADGVRAILHTWPVLQIAVDQGFGGVYGQQKADWMVDVVQQYFHDNADLQQYEVEDFIADLLDNEFDTVVDDGSLPQVCGALNAAFRLWRVGDYQQLRENITALTQRGGRATARAPPGDPDSDPESDPDTQVMEVDSSRTEAPPPNPEAPPSPPEAPPPPDEDDGWTVVRKKK